MYLNSTTTFLRKFTPYAILIAVFSMLASLSNAQNCNADKTNGILAGSLTSSGATQPVTNAFDNIRSSFWYVAAGGASPNTGNVRIDLGTATVITNYSITSGPAQGTLNSTFDPKDFLLSGSNDGTNFTVLDARTNEVFSNRLQTRYYSFASPTAYRYYRLTINTNNGAASNAFYIGEIQLLTNSDCVVGNVYNNNAGTAYPSIPVTLRTTAGTASTTTTDATGHFVFSTANTPDVDFAVIITPPANTYFYSDPVFNINSSALGAEVLAKMPQNLWAAGSFLNVNGNAASITNLQYLVDNTEGAKTPASLDWILRPSPLNAPVCPIISTTLDGNGTFGDLTSSEYLSNHPWQPGFHTGPLTLAGESHPGLFRPLSGATSGYINGNLIYSNRGSLYDEGKYNVTSYIGTIQDASFVYGGFSSGTSLNSCFNVLNGYAGGWRKTYGRTTGDAYDLFLAANGQTSAAGSIIEFTANITSTGTKYINFYGKNANSFTQGINTNVEILLTAFNPSNVSIASTTLTLSPVTSAAQDNPRSPWEGRSFTFTANTTGTYTFKLAVPTTSQLGNDFYLDNIQLTECPIQYNLTGTVWNDANGNATQNGGESGTNAGNTLFVNLVDANGFIVSSVRVNADGTYTMPIPSDVTGYKLVLTNNAALATPSLPAGWVSTGENVDPLNPATQSGTLGVIELNTGFTNIPGQNFGIQRPPTSTNVGQTVNYPTGGTIPAGSVSTNIVGNDGEDGVLGNSNTMVITALPANATVLYNGVPVTLNQQITNFNPALLSYSNITNGSASVVFNYAFIDAAGAQGTSSTYSVNWLYALPIKLENFTVVASSCDKVELSWKIADASNFSHFEVEKSMNGTDFRTVAVVLYDATLSTYKFNETNQGKGNYQYRLKQVDNGGQAKYSTIVFVRLDCNQQQILVFPNPARDRVTINGLSGGEQLTLYNAAGQVMQSRKVIGYQENINISAYASGMYYLVIADKNGIRIAEQKINKVN
jgi:Secretion system C-terminal sorting domain/F5/8 type C domain